MSNTSMQPPLRSPVMDHPILDALAENWWLFLLRGIAAIIFGILAFVWPGITLLSLTLVFGAYALVDGICALWSAISGHSSEVVPRWWLAVVGVAGVLAGLIAFCERVWTEASGAANGLADAAGSTKIGLQRLAKTDVTFCMAE